MKIGLQFAMPAEFHALPGAKELEAFETVSGVPFYEAAPGIIACAGGVSKVNAAMGSVLLLWHEAREASVNGASHRQPGGRQGLCAARCGHLCHR